MSDTSSRNILSDISEARGTLCQLREVVEEHGLYQVMAAIDAGLQLYEADEVLFVQMASFRLFCEMLDRDNGGYNTMNEAVEGVEPLQAA